MLTTRSLPASAYCAVLDSGSTRALLVVPSLAGASTPVLDEVIVEILDEVVSAAAAGRVPRV